MTDRSGAAFATLAGAVALAALGLAGAAAARPACLSPTATAVPVGPAATAGDDPSLGYVCSEVAEVTGSVSPDASSPDATWLGLPARRGMAESASGYLDAR